MTKEMQKNVSRLHTAEIATRDIWDWD